MTQQLDNNAVNLMLNAAQVICQSLNSSRSITQLLALLDSHMGLNKARVVLPRDDNQLFIRYSHGLSIEECTRGIYAIGEGITGQVMSTGNIALIPDISQEPLYLARASDSIGNHSEKVAYIAVPILHDDKPQGVLAVYRSHPEQRQLNQDIQVLQIIAAMIHQVLRIDSLVAEKTASLQQENVELKSALNGGHAGFDIVGSSPKLKQAIKQAMNVASSRATVMLYGESGTGKEKFARMIHMASDRSDRPFVTINCAAIPENLLESELFGHVKGAYTGAHKDHKGKFELAHGGTLFLDEIGDMPLELQAKLLRTLQEKTIQPIGSNAEIEIDVRILTATHKDIQEAVNLGRFRLDLYYRLNVLPINLPPLRERGEDIQQLALMFLNRANQKNCSNVMLTPEAMQVLQNYSWPGNIRQLENVIERMVVMAEENVIRENHMEAILANERSITQSDTIKLPAMPMMDNGYPALLQNRPYQRVKSDDKARILSALDASHGNKTRAALNLGMTPRQLQYRMQKLQIECD